MRIMRSISIGMLILSSFLIQSCAFTPAPTRTKQLALPRFEQASCPPASNTSNGRTVRCGILVVPEDRGQPANHRVIRLAVEIIKSPNASSVSDPVLFLQGGPGAALLDVFGSRPERLPFAAFARASNRDVILLDQRGAGQSQPALTCPELDATGWRPVIQFLTLDQKMSMADKQARQARAEQHCSDRLIHQGVNPAAYTVSADAEDVRDLRQALGYKTWNIFAVSYGTRVAQAVMRIDPVGLRSVVLDSVLPAQSSGPFAIMNSTQQALNAVFGECAQDTSCTALYPHPNAVFLHLIDQLNAHPIELPMMDGQATTASTGKTYLEPANGETLIDAVFSLLQTTHIHILLPHMLYQLQAGNNALFAQIYAQAVSVPLHFSQGTFFSMVCSDDAPSTTEQQISKDAQTLSPALQSLFQNQLTNLWRGCQKWNVPGVASPEKAPVKSTVPTLILSGEHDPLTSWTGVTRMRQGLTKSVAVRFPDTGHGVLDGTRCSSSVIAAFLDHLQQPDTSCTLFKQ